MFRMFRRLTWTLLLLGLVAGCTRNQYAHQADKAAYSTIGSARKVALGESEPFDVTYQPLMPSDDKSARSIHIGQKIIPMTGESPVVLTLAECLEIALRNSRDFQNRKETLYSSALAVANASREWNWALLTGSVTGEADTAYESKAGRTSSAEGSGELSLAKKFVHGGVLTLAATVNMATDFLGGKNSVIGSLLEANINQPLLRGAWRGFAYEDQYRLQRDFIFAVFDYERFTQTFAVDIATRYYDVLRQRDQLAVRQQSIASLEGTVSVTKIRVDGDEASQVELDEAKQNLLVSQIDYENQQREYWDRVDRFKIALGLPIVAAVKLDYPAALNSLHPVQGNQLPAIPMDEPKAISLALLARPDVLTERAKVRDAQRDVEIAADAFNPKLDLVAGISAPGTGKQDFYDIQFDRNTRHAGLEFNYELDQTDNRDAYRNVVIALEKAKRDFDKFIDQVRLDVKQSYRVLVQTRNNYMRQVENEQIAWRRHKLVSIEQSEGWADADDVLRAEQALRNAQNGLTSALVTYTTTRLEFLAKLGMIRIDEKGMFHERDEPSRFDRIEQRYPAGRSQ